MLVVDRAIKFVERHRGLIPQNSELVIDGTAQSIENPYFRYENSSR